jgi:hypothetical protein
MLWIGIGITIVALIVKAVTLRTHRARIDLGSVSDHWIAQHKVDLR